jgi:hypothetical protein
VRERFATDTANAQPACGEIATCSRHSRGPRGCAQVGARTPRLSTEERGRGRSLTSFLSTVPELTRNASIQLNRRLSLRGQLRPLSSPHRTISPRPGPPRQSRQAIILRLAALFFDLNKAEIEMSDLVVTKQLDRSPAAFLRFAGPDEYVIEVDGSERTIARDFWRALPHSTIKGHNSPDV